MNWRPMDMAPQYLSTLGLVRDLIAKALSEGNMKDLPILRSMEQDVQWTVGYIATGDDSVYGRYRRCIPIDPQKLAKWVRDGQLYTPIHNRNAARDDLLPIISNLSQRQQEAYLMHVGEGMSYRAVGKLLGISMWTARSYVDDAKRKIAQTRNGCTNK